MPGVKEQVPIQIVGGSQFGLYPKINISKTYNMFISDDWLVSYAGYKKRAQAPRAINQSLSGRGLYHSTKGGFLLTVIASTVFTIDENLQYTSIGSLDTSVGEVFIDENLAKQIMIVDGVNGYVYNYSNDTFTKLNPAALTFTPNYVAYHNSYFLMTPVPGTTNPNKWYAVTLDPATNLLDPATPLEMALETKPDSAIAVSRLPGRGNNVIVFGQTVCEIWTQIGGESVPYRRVSSFNIDNGCVSVSTIANNDKFVCWLGQNENNAPVLMVSDGSNVESISTDGIDSLLESIVHPSQSTAFFYKQNGHLFYQLTFYNVDDNISLFYDFNTQKFFHASDEKTNYFPAREVVYFNQASYFISLNDPNLYEISQDLISYDYSTDVDSVGQEIPRVRICETVRRPSSDTFKCLDFTFWMEQGVNNYYLTNVDEEVCEGVIITESGGDRVISETGAVLLVETGSCGINHRRPRADMSYSKDGNQNFSSIVSRYLNPQGVYRNIITWHRMGRCNEFTIQLRFWGLQRFVCQNGLLKIEYRQ